MNTAAKVAIGCVVAAVGIAVVALVGFGILGYWAAGKAKQAVQDVVGDQKKMAELQEKANANAFEPAADGALTESRLVTFLDVRKRVYDVYVKNRAAADAIVKKGREEGASFGDLKDGMAFITTARAARLQGLADLGMSEAEYAYYVGAVYTSMVASEVDKATGGKTVSAAVQEQLDKQLREIDEAAKYAMDDPNLSPEQRAMIAQSLKQAREQIRQQGGDAAREAGAGDVPEANVVLFRKYEAEIKKYSMGGLEILGL